MKSLRIGTRKSPLALAQAQLVKEALLKIRPDLESSIEIVAMTTTGDNIQDRKLIEMGGKSLFTKEIEEALLQDRVDIAVHSLKDMPYELPEGLAIGAVLKREDPRDAYVSPSSQKLQDLPPGAKVATASLRRQAQLLHHYPHLEIVPIRGNVGTRLQKLEEGLAVGTFLAVAGLNRLNLSSHITEIMSIDQMIPAVGQGTIAVEYRVRDEHTYALLQQFNHLESWQTMIAERSFMKIIEGSCRTPLGAYAQIEGNHMVLQGFIASDDGKNLYKEEITGDINTAEDLGKVLGESLKRKV